MKEIFILLTVVATAKAIAGGHDTTIQRHKHMASLRQDEKHFCGAIILDKDWALTAASCLDVYSSDLSIRAKSINLTPKNETDGYKVDVKSFVKHPKYNKITQESDIALIKFEKSLEDDDIYTLLPFLENTDPPNDRGISLTGWGITKTGGSFSEILQMGYSSVMSRDICQTAYPSKVISLNMFCSGWYNVQNITACNGDIGGPATINNCVHGVISWGGKCGDVKSPTVMTRIAGYKDWILNTTGITNYLNC